MLEAAGGDFQETNKVFAKPWVDCGAEEDVEGVPKLKKQRALLLSY